MSVLHAELSLRIERLENILGKWEERFASRTDSVTGAHDAGMAKAYSHCREMLKAFAELLADNDEAGLADTLQDWEDELEAEKEDDDE